MAEYSFLRVDEAERVVSTFSADYIDDLAALDAAKSLCADYNVEIRCDERVVAFVKKGNAAAGVGDRVSG